MASRSEIECPLCNQEYTTPKILPCAHVTCRGCILSWLEKDAEKSCPVCRVPILPSRDLENSDLEAVIDHLSDDYGAAVVLQSQKILQQAPVCEACDAGNEATLFCFACILKFCPTCIKVHDKIPGSKQHPVEHIRSVTVERLAVKSGVACRHHAEKSVELYCPAHQEVLCVLCVPLHSGCGVKPQPVGEVAPGERQRLKDQGASFLHLGASLNDKISQLETELEQGTHNFPAARRAVQQHMDDLQHTLYTRRQQMLDFIQKQEEAFLVNTASQLSPLKKLSPLVIAHGHAAERLAASTPNGHLLTLLSKLKPRLHELERMAMAVMLPSSQVEPKPRKIEHDVKERKTSSVTTGSGPSHCLQDDDDHSKDVSITNGSPRCAEEEDIPSEHDSATMEHITRKVTSSPSELETISLDSFSEISSSLETPMITFPFTPMDSFSKISSRTETSMPSSPEVFTCFETSRITFPEFLSSLKMSLWSSEHTGVFSQTANSGVTCLPRDLVLDAQMVDQVKKSISNIGFKSGVSIGESEATITASSVSFPKTKVAAGCSVSCAGCEPAANENCTVAEDSTFIDRIANRSRATPQQRSILTSGSTDDIGKADECDSVKLLSSSEPSQLRASHDTFVHVDDRLSFDDIIPMSPDRPLKDNHLAAMSCKIVSFVTGFLENTDSPKALKSGQKESGAEYDPSAGTRAPVTTFRNDHCSCESSLASNSKRADSDSFTSGKGGHFFHPGTPVFAEHGASCSGLKASCSEQGTSSSEHGASSSDGSAEERARAETEKLQTWREAARDNFKNQSREAAQIQRPGSISLPHDESSASAAMCGAQASDKLITSSTNNKSPPSLFTSGREGEEEDVTDFMTTVVCSGSTVIPPARSNMGLAVSVGSRVMRGRDWSVFQPDVDGGPGRRGTVLRKGKGDRSFGKGWVLVHWDASGLRKWHRIGAEGCFDVTLP